MSYLSELESESGDARPAVGSDRPTMTSCYSREAVVWSTLCVCVCVCVCLCVSVSVCLCVGEGPGGLPCV